MKTEASRKQIPDFVVVGVAKAGTTSLFHYLNEFRNVYIPDRKECRFFSGMKGDFVGPGASFQNDVITDYDEYTALFEDSKSEILGDISNDYFYYHEESIRNLKKHTTENIKIIIILRNPVDRAYSNYLHHLREGWETLNFTDALDAEDSRMSSKWAWPFYYKNCGLYSNKLKNFKDNFDNVLILFYEEFATGKIFEKIEKFLELDSVYSGSAGIARKAQHNKSALPRSLYIRGLLKQSSSLNIILKSILTKKFRNRTRRFITSLNSRKAAPIAAEDRMRLIEYYREDIKNLEDFTSKNLDTWRST